MSHVSDRIVLNDAGTVKDIHPELAADFLCTQGRDGRATLTRQRAIPLHRVTCHAKRKPMPADQLTLRFLARWSAGLVSATAPQQLISTDQHSERPMLTDE